MRAEVDYYITKVRYNEDKPAIEHVEVRKAVNGKAKGRTTRFRSQIVEWIKDDVVFYTLYEKKDVKGKLTVKLGEKVIIHPLNKKEFIKTKPNNIEEDNLGELPEF